jgi:hypothetical protein
VSNEVEETDRARWDIPGALDVLATAVARVAGALQPA